MLSIGNTFSSYALKSNHKYFPKENKQLTAKTKQTNTYQLTNQQKIPRKTTRKQDTMSDNYQEKKQTPESKKRPICALIRHKIETMIIMFKDVRETWNYMQ